MDSYTKSLPQPTKGTNIYVRPTGVSLRRIMGAINRAREHQPSTIKMSQPTDIHCTLMYSTDTIVGKSLRGTNPTFEFPANFKQMSVFGPKNDTVVLELESDELKNRHKKWRLDGGFPTFAYNPHVTVATGYTGTSREKKWLEVLEEQFKDQTFSFTDEQSKAISMAIKVLGHVEIAAKANPKVVYKKGDHVITNYGTITVPEYYIGKVSKVSRDSMVHVDFPDGTYDAFKPTRSKAGLVGKVDPKKINAKTSVRKSAIPTAQIDKWLMVDMGEGGRTAKPNTPKGKKPVKKAPEKELKRKAIQKNVGRQDKYSKATEDIALYLQQFSKTRLNPSMVQSYLEGYDTPRLDSLLNKAIGKGIAKELQDHDLLEATLKALAAKKPMPARVRSIAEDAEDDPRLDITKLNAAFGRGKL